MADTFLEAIVRYHPGFCAALASCMLFVVIALAVRRRTAQLASLACLIVVALWLVFVVRQERRWAGDSARMFSTFYAGDREGSLAIARELLATARASYPPESQRVVESFHHVGWLLIHTGRAADAEPYLDTSLAGYQRLNSTLPDDDPLICTHGIGNEKSLLGFVYQQTSRFELAERMYREALDHYERRCPAYPQYRAEMTGALTKLDAVRRKH